MHLFTTPLPDSLLDPDYRHVGHADQLKLFESARLALLSDAGTPNDAFMAEGLFCVVSRLSAVYLRELREGPVTVSTGVVSATGRTVLLGQELRGPRDKVVTRAEVELMLMDGRSRRAVPFPERFAAALAGVGTFGPSSRTPR